MIPTNIITGFLGVGKTTTILNLLQQKSGNESWAVLVNEFGEIGIDSKFLTDQGALVKEVPGGCMCCTAGAPMSVGITALLRQKPDRLIIEPTGLGHPKQIISILLSEQYNQYVDLKATIALVDPRNLQSERHIKNRNFNDQLDSADVVIANKADECSEFELNYFNEWVVERKSIKKHSVTSNGLIDSQYLDLERGEREPIISSVYETYVIGKHSTKTNFDQSLPILEEVDQLLLSNQLFARKENKGQGYYSCGWVFQQECLFNFESIYNLVNSLTVERFKGVIHTDRGPYAVNNSNGEISFLQTGLKNFDTRIEIINATILDWAEIEYTLLKICGLEC